MLVCLHVIRGPRYDSDRRSQPGRAFFYQFVQPLMGSHRSTLHHLSTLLLPSHVQNDELAQRFRNEKYVIRMSRSGFGLLIGWLTEGIGGEGAGVGEGFSGEKGKRGRATVLQVVNNHLRFDGKYNVPPLSCIAQCSYLESQSPLRVPPRCQQTLGKSPLVYCLP